MRNRPGDRRGALAVIGLGAALVVCCALPLLLAAGVLGALGGVLANSWLTAAAGAVVAIALALTAARVYSRTRSPGDSSSQSSDP